MTIKEGRGTRKIIVPSRDPVAVPKLFKKEEYGRLKDQARVKIFDFPLLY